MQVIDFLPSAALAPLPLAVAAITHAVELAQSPQQSPCSSTVELEITVPPATEQSLLSLQPLPGLPWGSEKAEVALAAPRSASVSRAVARAILCGAVDAAEQLLTAAEFDKSCARPP